MGQNFSQDHGSHTSLNVQKVVDNPTELLQQVLTENQNLQKMNAELHEQLAEAIKAIEEQQAELKSLARFRQIIENPIEKVSVELFDDTLLDNIRGKMIQMFGQGGKMDAKGHWASTVVNDRLQIVIWQLLREGLRHWHRVKPLIEQVIKTRGLTKSLR